MSLQNGWWHIHNCIVELHCTSFRAWCYVTPMLKFLVMWIVSALSNFKQLLSSQCSGYEHLNLRRLYRLVELLGNITGKTFRILNARL